MSTAATVAGSATPSAVSPRQLKRHRRRVPKSVWIFLAVPVVVETAWVFWPAINSFYLSLTKWEGLGAPEFVGAENYRRLFEDPVVAEAFGNTAIWLVVYGTLTVIGGLALAIALNRPRRLIGVYRSAIYLPMVFALAITGSFWRVVYAPDGAADGAAGLLGIDNPPQWLADPDTALWAVIIAAVWAKVGYIMVLYLAGLKAVDPQLEDAAAVDGANSWQRFRYVVFPQLRGVSTVVFAVTVIDSLRMFDVVWAMTRGGPYHATELLSTYMYQQGFTFLNLGYGSALAIVIFVLALGFIITYLVRAARQEVI